MERFGPTNATVQEKRPYLFYCLLAFFSSFYIFIYIYIPLGSEFPSDDTHNMVGIFLNGANAFRTEILDAFQAISTVSVIPPSEDKVKNPEEMRFCDKSARVVMVTNTFPL